MTETNLPENQPEYLSWERGDRLVVNLLGRNLQPYFDDQRRINENREFLNLRKYFEGEIPTASLVDAKGIDITMVSMVWES